MYMALHCLSAKEGVGKEAVKKKRDMQMNIQRNVLSVLMKGDIKKMLSLCKKRKGMLK